MWQNLANTVEKLSEVVEMQEQYSRRNYLWLYGIPDESYENTEKNSLETINEHLEVEIKDEDIEQTHTHTHTYTHTHTKN